MDIYDFCVMQLKSHGRLPPLCVTCEIPLLDLPEDNIDDVDNVSNKWEALNAEIRDMYLDVKLSVGEKMKIKFLTNSVFEL